MLIWSDFQDMKPSFNNNFNNIIEFLAKRNSKATRLVLNILLFLKGRVILIIIWKSVYFSFSHSFNELPGKRIVLFSYGSGLASSMFTLVISEDTSQQTQLEKIHQCLKEVRERLNSRVKMTPEQFEQTLKLREETHHKGENHFG